MRTSPDVPALRVLSVIPALAQAIGGPGINLVDSAPHLRRAGVDLTIFTTDAGRPASARPFCRATPADFAASPGFAPRVFPVTRPYRFIATSSMARALSRETGGFDVLQIHGVHLFPHLAAFLAASRRGVPYVISPHGGLDPFIRARGEFRKKVMRVTWENRALRSAAAILTTTDEEAALLGSIAPGTPRVVVPNGIDVKAFAKVEGGDTFRRERLRGHTGPVVVHLGRITHKKGLDILIDAVAKTVVDVPDIHLAVVGPDDESLTPRLIALAHQLGVGDRVTFTGPLYGAERAGALDAADVWALASHTENFGNAVVEAVAAGCPVIVSPRVNIAEALGEAGAAEVAELDASSFASCLTRLLLNERRRQELRAAGPVFAQRYDWALVAPLKAEMLRAVAEGRVEDFIMRQQP